MYILPEDRLLVFLGVTVVGLVSGITVALAETIKANLE